MHRRPPSPHPNKLGTIMEDSATINNECLNQNNILEKLLCELKSIKNEIKQLNEKITK
jgi:hypothetical protein